MGKGLKKSRVSVFGLKFERYDPASGSSTDDYIKEFGDYYIAGVGSDYLPLSEHDDVFSTEINNDLHVYLEDKNDFSEPKWNKALKDGVFSGTISKISGSEFGDLELKAKWTQFLLRGNNEYNTSDFRQELVNIAKDATVFSWDESK